MQNPVGTILSNPFFLFFVSAAIFLVIVWALLPFALYGVRRRLDRNRRGLEEISETLGKILEVLERGGRIPAPSGPGASGPGASGPGASGPGASPTGRELENADSPGGLFSDLRKELQKFGPFLQERLLEPGEIEYFILDKDGVEIPGVFLSFRGNGVRASIPVVSLERVFPGFSSEQFRKYANSFLPEKHGYFMEPSSSGLEFHVNIEPRENNALELFVGIIREQMIDPIEGEGA